MRLINRISGIILYFMILFSCHPTGYSAIEKDGNVFVTMTEYEPAFRNTMKGWREFFSPGEDVKRSDYPYPFGTMIKEYMQWNMLENNVSDGVSKICDYSNHRWNSVEELNIKVIPRVYLVWIEPWHGGKAKSEDNPDDMNGWHWAADMPGQVAPYKNVPGEWTCYLEEKDSLTRITGGYFDENFPDRVRNLVKKLGEAWDNDPRVAFVEMGIIGEWGEHHDPDITTYWPPHDEVEHVEGRTWVRGIEKVLGDAFSSAFKNKKVMVRYAYDFKDYKFGIYWDSWAIEQEIDRGYNEMLALGDRWKTQVIGGEITWNWGNLKIEGKKSLEDCLTDPKTFSVILEQIRNLHCNHLGGVTWADFNNTAFLQKASELQKAMGHRFVLSKAVYPMSISPGEKCRLYFEVLNTGSSPFYYDWKVEVSLLDKNTLKKVAGEYLSNVDIRTWLPGDRWDKDKMEYMDSPKLNKIDTEVTFDDVPYGDYILALSILDPAGNVPSVRFANNNYIKGGYTALGYVSIGGALDKVQISEDVFSDIQEDRTLRYYVDN